MSAFIEGFSKSVFLQYFFDGCYELIVYFFTDVDPFDAAATLSRIEDRTIDDVLRSPTNVYVCSNVCRIFAT